MNDKKECIVLFSGGLDSTVTLYYAADKGYVPHLLTFVYGQRHIVEVERAKTIASKLGFEHRIIDISLPWKGSALLDDTIPIPENRTIGDTIPPTYVPARNTVFLSYAFSWADVIGAEVVFIGANQLDYSGYPDCRSEYLLAMERVFKLGTKRGVDGVDIKIEAPLINLKKSGIVRLGRKLNAPLELTWSCYSGGDEPCGVCDSCILRKKGFEEAGLENFDE